MDFEVEGFKVATSGLLTYFKHDEDRRRQKSAGTGLGRSSWRCGDTRMTGLKS